MELRSPGLAASIFTHGVTPSALIWVLYVLQSLVWWRLGLQKLDYWEVVGLSGGKAQRKLRHWGGVGDKPSQGLSGCGPSLSVLPICPEARWPLPHALVTMVD